MKHLLFKSLIIFLMLIGIKKSSYAQEKYVVKSLKVVILSTMLTDGPGIGEWGFAALVEANGHQILFDTGGRPETVLNNAKELGMDLTNVQDVILSHNHGDHTGGLLTLRKELMKSNTNALKRIHVAEGIFFSRPGTGSEHEGHEHNKMIEIKQKFEATGGSFLEYKRKAEIYPGIWITGPVTRKHPEYNWSGVGKIAINDQLFEDTIPEDQSLVIETSEGLVIISGCGHAGIINTMEYSKDQFKSTNIHAAIGGFHLLNLDNQDLGWTAIKLKEFGLQHFIGAHCTGIEPVFVIRKQAGLHRKTAVVGAIGSIFELGKGITTGSISR